MKWKVKITASDNIVAFEARYAFLDNGSLSLFNEALVIAFAPGEWKSCWPETTEAEHPELAVAMVSLDPAVDCYPLRTDWSRAEIGVSFKWLDSAKGGQSFYVNDLWAGRIKEIEEGNWSADTTSEDDAATLFTEDDAKGYVERRVRQRLTGAT